MSTRIGLLTFVISAIVSGVSLAQTQADSAPLAFEVASIKRSDSLEGSGSMRLPASNRVTATNIPLRSLVVFAYNLEGFQVIGGPGWVNTDRFVVVAQADGSPSIDEKRSMMRTLLEERFKLVVHREQRHLDGYALVVNGDRLGPKLRPSAAASTGGFTEGDGRLTGTAIAIPTLTTILTGFVGRIVVDRTGLSGHFDVDLEWSSDVASARADGAVASPSDAPSIFTAVREQLGLALQSQKVPAEVLVIDRAERPTPD